MSGAPAHRGYELSQLLLENSDINLELSGEHMLVAVFGISEPADESGARLVRGLADALDGFQPGSAAVSGARSALRPLGAAGDDSARGLPGPAGGRPDLAGRRAGRRRIPGRIPARIPNVFPASA